MFRKLLLVIGLLALLAPTGCNTTEPVMWSWPHNKPHLRALLDSFHDMHMDVDRIIFDFFPGGVGIRDIDPIPALIFRHHLVGRPVGEGDHLLAQGKSGGQIRAGGDEVEIVIR